MTNTNRSKTVLSAVGLFAMSLTALVAPQARAQDIKSIINFDTGTILSTAGSMSAGAGVVTQIYVAPMITTQQKWQFFEDYNVPGFPKPQIISSLSSFLDLDVFQHFPLPGAPAVQDARLLIDDSTPWKFQEWKLVVAPYQPNPNMRYYYLQNWGNGTCLTNLGNPTAVASLMQCDYSQSDIGKRQQWAIYNHSTGRWE